MVYVRYESTQVDPACGIEIGVSGLLNRLSRRGRLTDAHDEVRRVAYAWFDAAYVDPATVDASVYDTSLHPVTKAWFKEGTSHHLVERLPALLAILDAHDVSYRRSESQDLPGHLIYADDVQIVVVPWSL